MGGSAKAHIEGKDDDLVSAALLSKQQTDWAEFLASGLEDQVYESIRKHERNGRLGSEAFVARLEAETGRVLMRGKPGRKPGDVIAN